MKNPAKTNTAGLIFPVEIKWLIIKAVNIPPITKRINSVEIRECLYEPTQQIIENVKLTLEKCPPELAADLVEKGMVLVGGGALIKGLDKALIKETGLPVFVAPNPLLAVCMGTGKALEYLDRFKRKKRVG